MLVTNVKNNKCGDLTMPAFLPQVTQCTSVANRLDSPLPLSKFLEVIFMKCGLATNDTYSIPLRKYSYELQIHAKHNGIASIGRTTQIAGSLSHPNTDMGFKALIEVTCTPSCTFQERAQHYSEILLRH